MQQIPIIQEHDTSDLNRDQMTSVYATPQLGACTSENLVVNIGGLWTWGGERELCSTVAVRMVYLVPGAETRPHSNLTVLNESPHQCLDGVNVVNASATDCRIQSASGLATKSMPVQQTAEFTDCRIQTLSGCHQRQLVMLVESTENHWHVASATD